MGMKRDTDCIYRRQYILFAFIFVLVCSVPHSLFNADVDPGGTIDGGCSGKRLHPPLDPSPLVLRLQEEAGTAAASWATWSPRRAAMRAPCTSAMCAPTTPSGGRTFCGTCVATRASGRSRAPSATAALCTSTTSTGTASARTRGANSGRHHRSWRTFWNSSCSPSTTTFDV